MLMLERRRRALLISLTLMAALGLSAAPATAACVTAGASVRVGSVEATPVPHGTCVIPTPLPAWRTDEFYVNTSVVGVNVSVGTVSP